ncbi:hypothetical protein I5L01_06120 [Erythrobacter sp. YJ-T3-07]|uniref:PadR family transcriptional regulator n=1 Tax=Erythrobacter sp. YJ-T3-07 TaxID=2793063 RepID=UPI0018D4CBE2|nr:hypothetical protein [Erythrobacter sp. YJ-T3-07]MBH1943809.1 hypothetical protein [Erythrobacter sp. YJ-T3-07]
MLIIILIIACIFVLLAYLVVTVRRHDKNAYADRDRDPFYAEMARLAAAGLLYEEEERRVGRPRHSFIVTPAGEAALRTWLREPVNDPGLLRLYFAGIVGPADVVALAREQAAKCRERIEKYDRVEDLFGRKKGWDTEREHLALGKRFESFCLDFWEDQIAQPLNAQLFADDGGENESPSNASEASVQAGQSGPQEEDDSEKDD